MLMHYNLCLPKQDHGFHGHTRELKKGVEGTMQPHFFPLPLGFTPPTFLHPFPPNLNSEHFTHYRIS